MFHRTGQLRFNFQNVDLPAEVAQLKFPNPAPCPASPAIETQKVLRFRSQAILKGAEGTQAPGKVDSEGGVKATESKTRYIETAVALLIARTAADNDSGHARSGSGVGSGPESNVGGRTLGGGLGFGLISQSSKYVGTAFGYYGLAWSVYSTVIARGPDVQFDKNAVVDIGFNPRVPATASK